MACEVFDPKCPGCRPTVVDPDTNQVLPPDNPIMQAINRVFDAASREEQEAFHSVTIKNSRDARDLELLEGLSRRISVALKG